MEDFEFWKSFLYARKNKQQPNVSKIVILIAYTRLSDDSKNEVFDKNGQNNFRHTFLSVEMPKEAKNMIYFLRFSELLFQCFSIDFP